MKTKRCSICGLIVKKDFPKFFYRDNSKANGFKSYCKACAHVVYNRNNYLRGEAYFNGIYRCGHTFAENYFRSKGVNKLIFEKAR